MRDRTAEEVREREAGAGIIPGAVRGDATCEDESLKSVVGNIQHLCVAFHLPTIVYSAPFYKICRSVCIFFFNDSST